MKVQGNKLRCVFQGKENPSILGVKSNLDTVVLNENVQSSPDSHLLSICVNNRFNMDIQEGDLANSVVVKEFAHPTYKPPYRLYIYSDNEAIVISHIFINRVRVRRRAGQKTKYSVAAIDETGSTVPLFGFPCDTSDETEIQVNTHLINFEVERFLAQENITILDAKDVKYLFKMAVEYVNELRMV